MTRKTGRIVPALLWECSFGRNKPQGFVPCSQTRHFYARQSIVWAAGKKSAHIHILIDISTMKMKEVDGINSIWQDSYPQKRTQTPRQTEMPTVKAVKYPVFPDTSTYPAFSITKPYSCVGSWTSLSPEAPFNPRHKIPTSHGQEGSP